MFVYEADIVQWRSSNVSTHLVASVDMDEVLVEWLIGVFLFMCSVISILLLGIVFCCVEESDSDGRGGNLVHTPPASCTRTGCKCSSVGDTHLRPACLVSPNLHGI